MARQRTTPAGGLVAEDDQPLIAIPMEEEGRQVVWYFTDDVAADAALADHDVQEALDLAGAWSDLDWDDMERELHRIRHENPPTPPLDEL